MATVTLHETPFQTVGSLPAVESNLPDFNLTAADLSDKNLADFAGKKLLLNIFPSIDTGTCAASVRRFNAEASKLGDDVAVLCISRDLPFAQSRFCGAEGLDQVIVLSSLRDDKFGKDYGITFQDGPLAGLLSRSVVVADSDGIVKYTQQVAETSEEPDYKEALTALSAL
ncbi:MAG: thiol peroxidase [Spirochaetaceae bacterium]|nr:thiol peroxidase [Spirochaetaceae bacterium]